MWPRANGQRSSASNMSVEFPGFLNHSRNFYRKATVGVNLPHAHQWPIFNQKWVKGIWDGLCQNGLFKDRSIKIWIYFYPIIVTMEFPYFTLCYFITIIIIHYKHAQLLKSDNPFKYMDSVDLLKSNRKIPIKWVVIIYSSCSTFNIDRSECIFEHELHRYARLYNPFNIDWRPCIKPVSKINT